MSPILLTQCLRITITRTLSFIDQELLAIDQHMNVLDIALSIHEQKLQSIAPDVYQQASEPSTLQSSIQEVPKQEIQASTIVLPTAQPSATQAPTPQPGNALPPTQNVSTAQAPPQKSEANKKDDRIAELKKDEKLMKYFKRVTYGAKQSQVESNMKSEGYAEPQRLQV